MAVSLLSPAVRAGETVSQRNCPAAPVKAEPNPLSFWDGRIVLDIEERMRGEIRENNRDFDSSINDDNDDSWLLNRFRFGLAIKPVWWLKIYGQTQDAREAFSDRSNIPGVRGAEGDDPFDLRQGYISLGDVKNSRWSSPSAGRRSAMATDGWSPIRGGETSVAPSMPSGFVSRNRNIGWKDSPCVRSRSSATSSMPATRRIISAAFTSLPRWCRNKRPISTSSTATSTIISRISTRRIRLTQKAPLTDQPQALPR